MPDEDTSLLAAFNKGKQDKQAGVPVENNPYLPPPLLSRKLSQWDAWDAGHTGDSWENFTSTKLKIS